MHIRLRMRFRTLCLVDDSAVFFLAMRRTKYYNNSIDLGGQGHHDCGRRGCCRRGGRSRSRLSEIKPWY